MKSKKYSDKRLEDFRQYVERYFISNDRWKETHNDKNFVTRSELLTVAGLTATIIISILALILKK